MMTLLVLWLIELNYWTELNNSTKGKKNCKVVNLNLRLILILELYYLKVVT